MGGGRNDALPGKAPHSAAEVGGSFVLQYYRTLTTERENLHKYYKDESIVSRGVEGASPDQITYSAGVEEIREEIRSSAYSGASKTEINCIQSMESKQGGILVQVLGYLVYSESPEKIHFTQVFFLDKQTDPYPGYFVQNDILRYVTGKAEHSEFQAPPLLPPPQPPMLPAPTDSAAPAEVDVETPAAEEEEEATPAAEEEVALDEAAEEDAVMPEAVAVDDSAVAEAVAAAVAAEAEAAEAAEAVPIIPEEKPPAKSWASMAGKLKEGGGTLGPPSKLQGWSLPAPAAAKAKSTVSSKFTAASSTMPVLPPPSAALKAKAKAAELGQEAVEVRLWVSRIPTDQPPENQELVDCFNKLIAEVDENATVQIERKDVTKDWAYITVWSQEVADALVQLSKDRKVAVKGKILKVQIGHDEKPKFPSNNRRSPGKGGGEDGGDPKAADGGAGSRGPRRGKGAKGGGDAGGKGSKGGADSGSPSDKQAADGSRPKGGGRRGGEKGKGGGGEGNWRSQN